MKRLYSFKYFVLSGVIFLLFSFSSITIELPKGWFKAGSEPDKYEMGIEKGAGQDGKNVATIKSIADNIKGFGTLLQNCLPKKYLGKRVRMSGFLKSKDVAEYAGFWMRVDAAGAKDPLSFDNMSDRPIFGTNEWKKYEIVLDVPENASIIAYGILVSGKGQIWFDNISFEIVDTTVPVTGKLLEQRKNTTPEEPQNLNFEE